MDRHQRNTLSGNEVRAALTLGSRSHVGMKRSTNQDAFCAMVGGNAPPGTDALLAVADGMGGHQAGEVASDMVIRGLVAKLSQSGAVASTEDGYATALRRAFAEINSEIRAAATRPETRGMGTTLTAAVLAGDRLTVSHVGDSRAYLLRDGRLWQLTQDHSWVAEEVAKGRLTPQEAAEHPRRNILTQAMGIDSRVDPHSSTVPVLAGDVLFLCSDGLHGLVNDVEIARMLANQVPGAVSQEMVNLANARGGHDNITVVVGRIDSVNPRTGATNLAHRMTTLPGGVRASRRSRLNSVLRILSAPFWFPVWVLCRLLSAPFRRRK